MNKEEEAMRLRLQEMGWLKEPEIVVCKPVPFYKRWRFQRHIRGTGWPGFELRVNPIGLWVYVNSWGFSILWYGGSWPMKAT